MGIGDLIKNVSGVNIPNYDYLDYNKIILL